MDQAKTALAADGDEAVLNIIGGILAELGFDDVALVQDGEAAWQRLSSGPIGLVVTEWRLKGLSGMALLNRIRRSKVHAITPVLVTSGMVTRQDFRLLQDFACVGLVEKPLQPRLVRDGILKLESERSWQQSNQQLVDRVLRESENLDALLDEVRAALRNSIHSVSLAVQFARRLTDLGRMDGAKIILSGVLSVDRNSVLALNELGRACLKSGALNEAYDCLRRAEGLSSGNLDRLLTLGEVELHRLDSTKAEATFAKALGVDPAEVRAQQGLQMAKTMADPKLTAHDPTVVARSFVSLANSIGVTMVRRGEFERGIEHYKRALGFVFNDHDAARLSFNLGLGLLRWGKRAEGIAWLQKAAQRGGQSFTRAADLLRRLGAPVPQAVRPAAAASAVLPNRILEATKPLTNAVDSPSSGDLDAIFQEESLVTAVKGSPDGAAKIDEGSGELDFSDVDLDGLEDASLEDPDLDDVA